ncbi:LysM peptidoglycan-binding domain-containing protein [Aspergillus lucknowensis]|uniref:LysM domain-containing protein n=1 Tax=Aspergillus lucknowensis TaxID=176173 RepID=A0ABR4LSL0_9EURO
MSTWLLLNTNELQAYCQNFPEAGTELCLLKACTVYMLKENNTCNSIIKGLPSRVLPQDPNIVLQPLAKGTWSNCTVYTTYLNLIEPEYDNACLTVSRFYNVTVAQLQKWNLSLDEDTSKCQIKDGYRYCAVEKRDPPLTTPTPTPTSTLTTTLTPTETPTTTTTTTTSTSTSSPTPSPIQDGMTKKCNKFYKVRKGATCELIAKKYDIDFEDFYAWNPAVKDDCSKLLLDFYVCVGIRRCWVEIPGLYDYISSLCIG